MSETSSRIEKIKAFILEDACEIAEPVASGRGHAKTDTMADIPSHAAGVGKPVCSLPDSLSLADKTVLGVPGQ
jgi:hypothetical protein